MLKTMFEVMLTQMNKAKAQSCEVFDYFGVVAIKNTFVNTKTSGI